MIDSDKQAADKLQELGLPQIFMDIWNSKGPRRFCKHWTRPTQFLERWQDLVKRFDGFGNLIPLLESHGDHLLAYDASQKVYVEFYLEDIGFKPIGRTYQQFLSSMFVDFGYAGLDDLVAEVSDDFGYQHLDKFMKFFEADDNLTPKAAKQAFVDSIPN